MSGNNSPIPCWTLAPAWFVSPSHLRLLQEEVQRHLTPFSPEQLERLERLGREVWREHFLPPPPFATIGSEADSPLTGIYLGRSAFWVPASVVLAIQLDDSTVVLPPDILMLPDNVVTNGLAIVVGMHRMLSGTGTIDASEARELCRELASAPDAGACAHAARFAGAVVARSLDRQRDTVNLEAIGRASPISPDPLIVAMQTLARLRCGKPVTETSHLGRLLAARSRDIAARLRPLRISFVSFGSPWHYALWNNLSIESLIGDVAGRFGPSVTTEYQRVVSPQEVEILTSRLVADPPDILAASIEHGTLGYADLFFSLWHEKAAAVPADRARPWLVFGNHIPTYRPNRVAHLGKTGFEKTFVVRGEGERPLRAIISDRLGIPSEPGSLESMECGDATCLRVPDGELAALVFPPSTTTVTPGITNMIQSSRGCVFHCSFCTQGPGKRWLDLPIERVASNIQALAMAGVSEFEFCDDEFFGGRSAARLDRIRAIISVLRATQEALGVQFVFRLFTTPLVVYRSADNDVVRHQNREIERLLGDLKSVGLRRVYVGVESGSKSQRERYARSDTLADVEGALAVLRRLKLDIDVGFIMFDAEMSLEELRENLSFFCANNLVEHNTWPFRPLVVNDGTPLEKHLREKGLLTGLDRDDQLEWEYRFADVRVERIHRSVDALSAETRSLFYSVKVISKAHWGRERETEEVRLAKRIARDNAVIYLDLMSALVIAEERGEQNVAAIGAARMRVLELVRQIAQAMKEGVWSERSRVELRQRLLEVGVDAGAEVSISHVEPG